MVDGGESHKFSLSAPSEWKPASLFWLCWHLLLVPTFKHAHFERGKRSACLLVYLSCKFRNPQDPQPPSWHGNKDKKKCGRWLLFSRWLKGKKSSRFDSNDTPSTASGSSLSWPHPALSLYVTLHKKASAQHSNVNTAGQSFFKLIEPHAASESGHSSAEKTEKRERTSCRLRAPYCPSRPRRGGSWAQWCWREKLNLLSS